MQLETFLLFAPACFAINMAFGPNNLLSLTNAARSGITPAIVAAAGRIVSFAVMIAIAGVGLGAVLAASETLFTAVKWAGALYLIWIGIKLIRARAPLLDSTETATRSSLRKLTLQELWVAAGNPKAILVFTRLLSAVRRSPILCAELHHPRRDLPGLRNLRHRGLCLHRREARTLYAQWPRPHAGSTGRAER